MSTLSTAGNTSLAAENKTHGEPHRVATETKSAFKTTEFVVYILSVVAVLIAAATTDRGDDGQGFGAERAWMFVTFLTIGYMVSRGLAKSGSYEKERQSTEH